MNGAAPRLAPGHHLYAVDDGVWRCMKPDGAIVLIRGRTDLMVSLQAVLHGGASVDGVCSGDAERAVLSRLVESFASQGLLATPSVTNGRGDGHTRSRKVRVEGDNPVANLVAALLADHATVMTGPLDAAAINADDVLVAVAGWLPDRRWREVDYLCTDRRVPFHRAHMEGTNFFVGPFSVPGVTASYSDTRARLLAAADEPDELEQHWCYLDKTHLTPPAPWPSAGGSAVVAGILVADILAHLDGRHLPSAGCQLEVDLDRLSVVRHPVLPLPRFPAPDPEY